MSNQPERWIIKIDPLHLCMGGGGPDSDDPCSRLTEWAEATSESAECPRQLRVHPYCWAHLFVGFAEREDGSLPPEEQAIEHFCITNFVVHHLGGQASVLGRCPTDNIPAPYEACEDFEDLAWYVSSHDEQGQEHHGVAVYLTSWENWWEWYPIKSS